MSNIVLAAKIDYLRNYANNQFNENKGLRLNSKDWKSFVSVKKKDFYSFLRNGTIVFTTKSDISGKSYNQPIKLKNFKKIESILFILFLCKLPDNKIVEFLNTYMSTEDIRARCTCPAFLYYGAAYNLTQIDSIYGPEENRPPVEKDKARKNLVCKHLWIVINDYMTHVNTFASGLIRYYKRFFGIQSPTGVDRLKKQIRKKELIKILEQVYKQLKELKNSKLENLYNDLTRNTIKELQDYITPSIPEPIKSVEEKPIQKEEPMENNNFDEDDINEMIDNAGALSARREARKRKLLGAVKK